MNDDDDCLVNYKSPVAKYTLQDISKAKYNRGKQICWLTLKSWSVGNAKQEIYFMMPNIQLLSILCDIQVTHFLICKLQCMVKLQINALISKVFFYLDIYIRVIHPLLRGHSTRCQPSYVWPL